MSSGFPSSCYWTDWNWANTENIRIGLVFAVLAQWKFLYCIHRFDHIKVNKSKLIMININKVIGNRSTFLSGGVTLCTQNVKYFCHLSINIYHCSIEPFEIFCQNAYYIDIVIQ
jgi:hypothetical protein